MLYINNPYTDAWFNLAAEEYLLKNFSDDIFMLWQNEPSVIIGKHQNVWDEINRNYIQEKHIKVVRRYSGHFYTKQQGTRIRHIHSPADRLPCHIRHPGRG